jgi:hypothetical protein
MARVAEPALAEARRIGAKTFVSAKPCIRGHIGPFHTSNGSCAECTRLRGAKWKAENREHRLSYNRAYTGRWRQSEANRARLEASSRKWREDNKPLIAARSALRRARILKRTPAWADKQAIRCMYEIAHRISKCTGLEWHVDHVLPLNGREVSGLHIHTNMQIIPAKANHTKSNKMVLA